MATVTLGQAAKLAGVGKTTLARAIRAGRLSASRRDDGGYVIEVAELERVFPLHTPETPAETPAAHHATVALQAQLALAESRLGDFRTMVEDLKQQRDAWQAQAQRLALTDQRSRSWWRRLAG